MARDAVVEIDLQWRSKGTTHVQKMKGTIQEIANAVKKLDTSKFNKSLNVTQRDLEQMSKTIANNGNMFKAMGNKAIVTAKEMKKQYKDLNKLQFNQSNNSYWKMDGGKKIRITKQQYQEYVKLNKEIILYNQNLRKAGTYENAKIKRTQHAVQTNTALALSLRKVLEASKSRAIRSYSDQISKLSKDMDLAGVSTKRQTELLANLHAKLKQMQGLDTSKLANNMAAKGGSLFDAKEYGANIQHQLKQETREIQKALASARPKTSFSSLLGGLGTGAIGALGFTAIDIGAKISEAFSSKRLTGQLSGASSSLASVVGGVFGDAVGSIAGDIGKFAGTVGEVLLNTLTFSFRKTMAFLGGFLKGMGTGLISAAMGPIKGAGALFMGVLSGSILGVIQGTLSVWKETMNEILDIGKKVMDGLVALLSAGFKTVGAIFGSAFKIISTTWNSLWNGMKQVVTDTMNFTLDAIAKISSSSVESFAKQETLATKAAKETLGSPGGGNVGNMGNLARSTAAIFGTDISDTQEALFDVVSSGYQKLTEANQILSASARLAKQDSSSVANATNALITIYQNYGDQIKEVSRVSDILSAATTVGRTSLMEMGPSLKSVIPTARMFNIQLEDVMVSISALTRIFGRGSTPSATRYLSRFLESIAQPSERAKKELDKLGISLDMLQKKGGILEAMSRVSKAGPETIRKFMPTIQARRASALSTERGQEVFRTTRTQFEASLGGGGEKLSLEQETLANRLQKVVAIIESMKSKYGQFISSVLKGILFNKTMNRLWQQLSKIVNSSRMDETMKKLSSVAQQILLPVMKIVVATFQKFIGLVKGFALGDIFKSETFKTLSRELKLLLENVYKGITNIKTSGVASFFSSMKDKAIEAFKWIRIGFGWLAEGPQKFISKLQEKVFTFWEGFKDIAKQTLSNTVNEIGTFFANALSGTSGDFSLSKLFAHIPEDLKNLFKLGLLGVEKMFIISFLKIRDVIASIFSTLPDMMQKLIKTGFNEIKNVINSMFEAAEKMNDLMNPGQTVNRYKTAKSEVHSMTGGIYGTKYGTGGAIPELDQLVSEYRNGTDILKSVSNLLLQAQKSPLNAVNPQASGIISDNLMKIFKAQRMESQGDSTLANILREEFKGALAFDQDKILTARSQFNGFFNNSKKPSTGSFINDIDNKIVTTLNDRLSTLDTSINKMRETFQSNIKPVPNITSSTVPVNKNTNNPIAGNQFSQWFQSKSGNVLDSLRKVIPRNSYMGDDPNTGARLSTKFLDANGTNIGGNLEAGAGLLKYAQSRFNTYGQKMGQAVNQGLISPEDAKAKVADTYKQMIDALKSVDKGISKWQKLNMTKEDLYDAFDRALNNNRNKTQKVTIDKSGRTNHGKDIGNNIDHRNN